MSLEFLELDSAQRTRAINEAASRRNVSPIIVEKDKVHQVIFTESGVLLVGMVTTGIPNCLDD